MLVGQRATIQRGERTFSSMKRLKTPLRNTMTDDLLSSLAMLHIHKEKEINVESVLDLFAQQKERRLALCLNMITVL